MFPEVWISTTKLQTSSLQSWKLFILSTESGIGLKETNNVELNIAETGNNNQYQELRKWFGDLWKSKEAHKTKTIIDKNGKKHKTPFKEYLIESIEQIFIKYTPKQLYYKVLFELFGNQLISEQDNPEFNRQVGRLENTIIYNTLYGFQQKGALSLIKILQKYDGAILKDLLRSLNYLMKKNGVLPPVKKTFLKMSKQYRQWTEWTAEDETCRIRSSS